MLKFTIVLLAVFVVSVVNGWHEDRVTITKDDCIETIQKLLKTYKPLYADGDEPLSMKIETALGNITQKMKQQLEGLLESAAKAPEFSVYPHEIRVLIYSGDRVYCSRKISYQIAQICYNATADAFRAKMTNDIIRIDQKSITEGASYSMINQ